MKIRDKRDGGIYNQIVWICDEDPFIHVRAEAFKETNKNGHETGEYELGTIPKEHAEIIEETQEMKELQKVKLVKEELERRIMGALNLASQYGGIDGAHHKTWVIDQMLRTLLGDEISYNLFIAQIKNGEDGPESYSWDVGIAP